MPRPKRGDPELLLVSFCDIVTITTAALFMAMIIVIDEASRIPVIHPIPIVRTTTNAPVYFECRNDMVYPVDYAGLHKTFIEQSEEYQKDAGSGAVALLKRLGNLDVGNKYYKIDFGTALMGVMGLRPRPAIQGTTIGELENTVTNDFRVRIAGINTNSQFCVFFVRGDSFAVFRLCRNLCMTKGISHGWSYVARDEPITFVGEMGHIGMIGQ